MEPAKFIISRNIIKSQVDLLKGIFDDISYSWKTNPYVGKILAENQLTDFSIISVNELRQFIEFSQNPELCSKVWFFPLAINFEDLDYVFKVGVTRFVVDNLQDLNTLLEYVKTNNKKINLLLRMKLRENSVFTGKHYVFGMNLNTIKDLLPKLSENQNIEFLGIHFHRKTQNVSEWSLKEEIEHSLGDEYLKFVDIINLGGGLPANYCNIHDNALESIFSKIKLLKDYLEKFGVKLYIEPGRFIAAPSVVLETKIIAIQENTLFLNFSIFSGALDTVVANIKLKVRDELEKGERYMLKGCTPDSCDILRYSVYLDNPKVGDKVVFESCGAYTYFTDFCSLDRPTIIFKD